MNKNRRIIWLSANLFGYELLKEALKEKIANIIAIATLSEKAKTKMYDGVERNRWHKFDIPVYEIENINKEVELLRSLRPDIIIMCGWRQIIDKEILSLPKGGIIGFHPTLLPKGRGPVPIINTILEGYKESGVTMFYLTEAVDGGDIIGQARFSVDKNDYAQDIYDKVIEGGKQLIKKFLPLLVRGKAPRIPQDDKKATYLPKITLKDNEIKPGKETLEEIDKKIRAFSMPYNGAYIRLKNKKLIIWRAELEDEKIS